MAGPVALFSLLPKCQRTSFNEACSRRSWCNTIWFWKVVSNLVHKWSLFFGANAVTATANMPIQTRASRAHVSPRGLWATVVIEGAWPLFVAQSMQVRLHIKTFSIGFHFELSVHSIVTSLYCRVPIHHTGARRWHGLTVLTQSPIMCGSKYIGFWASGIVMQVHSVMYSTV